MKGRMNKSEVPGQPMFSTEESLGENELGCLRLG
jgi:hypothetical protein